jgi:hypothetical protein
LPADDPLAVACERRSTRSARSLHRAEELAVDVAEAIESAA